MTSMYTRFYTVEGQKRGERWHYCSKECARRHWPGIDDVDIEASDVAWERRHYHGLSLDPEHPRWQRDEEVIAEYGGLDIVCAECGKAVP